MSAEMETAWGHVPALRFSGYTSAEYLRIQYELKHREVPSSVIMNLLPIDDREYLDEWFSVRVQVDQHADAIQLKPEEILLWLPHYVLHVQPNGHAYAYFPDGRVINVIDEGMIP